VVDFRIGWTLGVVAVTTLSHRIKLPGFFKLQRLKMSFNDESKILKNLNLCIKGYTHKIETNVLDWEREK